MRVNKIDWLASPFVEEVSYEEFLEKALDVADRVVDEMHAGCGLYNHYRDLNNYVVDKVEEYHAAIDRLTGD